MTYDEYHDTTFDSTRLSSLPVVSYDIGTSTLPPPKQIHSGLVSRFLFSIIRLS